MGPARAAEWRKGDFQVSTTLRRMNLGVIHGYLSRESYWASGIPRATLEKSLRNSLCFGVLHKGAQVGFARVVSDFVTMAYLGDVFVLPEYRGRGLAKWMMECIMEHPELRGLRRWILVTADSHGLYQKYGFQQLAHPEKFMEIHAPGVYAKAARSGEKKLKSHPIRRKNKR